ncbi:MAG: toxin-antitoxin system HicB family antitoxin [Chloroflexi bacterium]|nr:toxin-antitoxin system HicB family antitoxin [Chloroflexota bacterium]
MSEIDARAAALASRPYAFVMTEGEDGVCTVQALELPGVISEGETPEEAFATARGALAGVLAAMLERGQEVPEPFELREFSGITQLRMPPSLHARAVALASHDNVSLNRFLTTAIAHYVGYGEANNATAEEAMDPEVKGLADSLMGVVKETFGQIPDLNEVSGPSLYTDRSPAAEQARDVGEEPVEEVVRQGWYAIRIMGELQFTLAYLLLLDDALFISPWVLVRSHLEMASRATWLLDPSVDSIKRVERSLTIQLDEIQRSRSFVNDVASFFGETRLPGRKGALEELLTRWSYLEAQAEDLGIEIRPVGKQPRRIKSVGATKVLGPGEMASESIGQGRDYGLLSAMGHYRPMTVFSLTDTRVKLLDFGRKVLQWFAISAWYFFELCGFDLAELKGTLEEAWDHADLPDDTRFWKVRSDPST